MEKQMNGVVNLRGASQALDIAHFAVHPCCILFVHASTGVSLSRTTHERASLLLGQYSLHKTIHKGDNDTSLTLLGFALDFIGALFDLVGSFLLVLLSL